MRPINRWVPLLLVCLMALTACYHRRPDTPDAFMQTGAFPSMTERQIDSLSFQSVHHYTNGYNFIVAKDSLCLLKQQPEELLSNMPTDSFYVYKNEPLVVADIRFLSTDTIDSVWVQVARDQVSFGWVREKELLKQVSPDDPISEFITIFSDIHLIIFLAVIVLIGMSYWARLYMKKQVPLVHFRDIDSFYPTLLALIVAASATFYASIQMYAPELWRHFYYHPTLNPFSVPPILSIFLISVWAMLLAAIAAVDDARRQLPTAEALLYLSGLVAVCAFNYLLFSISTLYYIGYLLLVIYAVYAVWHYFRYHRARYECGQCGHKLHAKGRCPNCGAMNE
ncbi:MAG: zinc ribbon domain-containing protein [Prevotella sp.]|nr:zinc ribbon domain-containing protein [Prevotella sp.]